MSYNADQASREKLATAATAVDGSPARVVTLTPSETSGRQEESEEGLLHDLVSSPTPTFHIESAITRGQTPLRSVFLSDRFIVGAVVVAAVVIPFALYDSRQPNPPAP